MTKIFVYLDESKQLSEWILILWGIITTSDISHVNAKVWNITDKLDIGKWTEMKSINKYGSIFYRKKWFQMLLADMSYMVCSDYITDYKKDSFSGYLQWLTKILSYISTELSCSEIILYIDDIKFWKTENHFLKWLQEFFPEVCKCSIKVSKHNRSIQLADLVTGVMRKYYLFKEEIDLEEYFPLCKILLGTKGKIHTKKSPPEVTSTSALVARTP